MSKSNKCSAMCYGTRNGMCAVLYEGSCRGYNQDCKFRATKDELKARQDTALKIIATKPENVQHKIADTYYGGKMPWNNL